jgi:hypothetical protein
VSRRLSWLAWLVVFTAPALARADGGELCQAATSASVSAARAALDKAPESLPSRFKLADALVEANCYHDAVHTLEDGATLHPRNAELQAKLRNTRSLVSEQEYFAGKEEAERAARMARNKLRCTRLADLDACDEVLRLMPGDIEAQRARRQSLLAKCESEGDAALNACQVVLPIGGEDEPRIRARITALTPRRSPSVPTPAANATPRPTSPQTDDASAEVSVPMVQVAQARTYSNAALPTRSH